MEALWTLNFAYRWSFTSRLNNAVLGLNNKQSFNKLLEKMKSISLTSDDLVKNFNPAKISYAISDHNKGSCFDYEPFRVLHSYLFDSAWLCADGVQPRLNSKSVCSFKEFAANVFVNESEFSMKNFFPGALTYHLHMKNLRPKYFKKNSYFFLFENYFLSVLERDINHTIKFIQ